MDNASSPDTSRWASIIERFEKIVILVLIVLLMVVVAIATIELGWLLIRDLLTARVLWLDMEEVFDLFGFFLIVLIGLELVASLKSYIRDGVIQVEVVIEVALTAVAQKIIILDTSRVGGLVLFGQAAMVLALAVSFWFMRTAHRRGESS